MPRVTPKVEPQDTTYVAELEYDVPADKLLEAIRQRQARQGKDDSRETVLKIANQVLESRA